MQQDFTQHVNNSLVTLLTKNNIDQKTKEKPVKCQYLLYKGYFLKRYFFFHLENKHTSKPRVYTCFLLGILWNSDDFLFGQHSSSRDRQRLLFRNGWHRAASWEENMEVFRESWDKGLPWKPAALLSPQVSCQGAEDHTPSGWKAWVGACTEDYSTDRGQRALWSHLPGLFQKVLKTLGITLEILFVLCTHNGVLIWHTNGSFLSRCGW